MRQIVLDTETTGLDPQLGHRIVEVACVEISNRRFTDRTFHHYLNPDRPSDPGALEVHGLTEEFLRDKPRFPDVVEDFLAFVSGAELVIHNAAFDLSFLDAELARLHRPPILKSAVSVLDTLKLARQLHPGKRNSLDALCERYGVDNSARTLHGALLDARLLGEVYLSMTRGQENLVIEEAAAEAGPMVQEVATGGLSFVLQRADANEEQAHHDYLLQLDKAVKGTCVWNALADLPAAS
jgi:DNA polymerase-3 subunit epsilon